MACKEEKKICSRQRTHAGELRYALAVQCERQAASRWNRNQKRRRGSGQSVPWRMLFDEQGSSVLGSLAPADLFYSFQHPLRHLLQAGSESSRVEDPTALTGRAFQLKRAETELYARQEGVNQLRKKKEKKESHPLIFQNQKEKKESLPFFSEGSPISLPYFSHVQCIVHNRVMIVLPPLTFSDSNIVFWQHLLISSFYKLKLNLFQLSVHTSDTAGC